jgi:hypothetical protein
MLVRPCWRRRWPRRPTCWMASVTSGPVVAPEKRWFDVALLHVIRATGLERHPDQQHEQAAQMACIPFTWSTRRPDHGVFLTPPSTP